jgi:hypothetical protein
MMTLSEAMRVLAAFEREQVQYVLVGSMGMAVLGLVRATRDIDFFVSPDPENVTRLRRALLSVFDDPALEQISPEDLGGDHPALQYVPPTGDYSIDIIARLGEAFCFEDLEWQDATIDGIRVRVATPAMLLRMKRDTLRPQDKADAAALRVRFGLTEE